jgi:hypothetical protein
LIDDKCTPTQCDDSQGRTCAPPKQCSNYNCVDPQPGQCVPDCTVGQVCLSGHCAVDLSGRDPADTSSIAIDSNTAKVLALLYSTGGLQNWLTAPYNSTPAPWGVLGNPKAGLALCMPDDKTGQLIVVGATTWTATEAGIYFTLPDATTGVNIALVYVSPTELKMQASATMSWALHIYTKPPGARQLSHSEPEWLNAQRRLPASRAWLSTQQPGAYPSEVPQRTCCDFCN